MDWLWKAGCRYFFLSDSPVYHLLDVPFPCEHECFASGTRVLPTVVALRKEADDPTPCQQSGHVVIRS